MKTEGISAIQAHFTAMVTVLLPHQALRCGSVPSPHEAYTVRNVTTNMRQEYIVYAWFREALAGNCEHSEKTVCHGFSALVRQHQPGFAGLKRRLWWVLQWRQFASHTSALPWLRGRFKHQKIGKNRYGSCDVLCAICCRLGSEDKDVDVFPPKLRSNH